jgi:hypothetical protein
MCAVGDANGFEGPQAGVGEVVIGKPRRGPLPTAKAPLTGLDPWNLLSQGLLPASPFRSGKGDRLLFRRFLLLLLFLP